MAFTGNNDLIEIVKRNRLRAEAGLPLLSAETENAQAASSPRSSRVGTRVTATTRNSPSVDRQQRRFANEHGPMISCPPTGARKDAKGPNLTLVNLIGSTHNLLVSQGYRLRDDTWNEHGRRTYIHDDDLARSHITGSMVLKSAGWRNDSEKLFSLFILIPMKALKSNRAVRILPDTSCII
jgi:hypothetical protein